jgi:hypothetical protein
MAVIWIVAIAFGQLVFNRLPNVIAVPIVVIAALMLLVDFSRWLDRNAY